MKRIFALIFSTVCFTYYSQGQNSTKGTEFWFGYMENLQLGINLSPQFYAIVSADEATTVKISIPGTGYEKETTLNADETREIGLPGVLYGSGSEIKTNLGCYIISQKPIGVKMVHARSFFSESSIVYPISMLGTKYEILTHEDIVKSSPNSFVIIATENDSRVTITPAATTLLFSQANVPFNITLQKGETYQVQAIGDLSTSKIICTNNKKIAVFCGARYIQLFSENDQNFGSTSHIFDQILPLEFAANSYIFLPFATTGGDPIRILFLEDETKLTINNSEIGSFKKGIIDTVINFACKITSNKPIFIAQFITSGKITQLGDPNLIFLQSMDDKGYNEAYKTYDGINNILFEKHFINFYCKTKDTGFVKLDNKKVNFGFKLIPSNEEYAYTTIEVSSGVHRLQSDSGYNGYAYGYGYADAYSFNLGVTSNNKLITPTNCNVLIPSAFSPNNDSINDNFSVFSNCPITNFNIEIYNRWGELLFQTNDIKKAWDGNYKEMTCQDGLYLYLIKYSTNTDKDVLKTGMFTLKK